MTEEKKMRYSRQREMIYEYLLSTEEHPTAEMIYDALKADMPALSLGTVYRNLKVLEELGKISRVNSYSDTERYDACISDHAHFLCTNCGSLRDIHDINRDMVRNSVTLPENYQVSNFALTIRGLCPKCMGKDN